jgi:hypothetical protein
VSDSRCGRGLFRFGEGRLGDWRDGEPWKLEPKDVAVCMLADDVPDLTGILVPRGEQGGGC